MTPENQPAAGNRAVITKHGETYTTPLFLPVYKYGEAPIDADRLQNEFGVRGIITNAFFLYKDRELKPQVMERGVKDFFGFHRLVVTDSGAFQQFSRPLYLSNTKIIAFQQEIGADVISPLDVITTPGENRTNAEKKLDATLKRIRKGLPLVDRATLVGVQQGGKFFPLRRRAVLELLEMGIEYLALGSLVPFFNTNHRVDFVGKIIKQARGLIPDTLPMHLYGAGDPLELPFYMAFGCDIFDSSSFYHYAKQGWFMTPYGAIRAEGRAKVTLPESVTTPTYAAHGDAIFQSETLLAEHNLWTILQTIRKASELLVQGTLEDYLQHIIDVHQAWFPESQLESSWHDAQAWSDTP